MSEVLESRTKREGVATVQGQTRHGAHMYALSLVWPPPTRHQKTVITLLPFSSDTVSDEAKTLFGLHPLFLLSLKLNTLFLSPLPI